MKINPFMLFIALGISGLASYGFFVAHIDEAYRLVITIGSLISLFVPLAGTLAVSLDSRGAVNFRILSFLFAIGSLVDNIIFTIKIKAWQLSLLKLAFGDSNLDIGNLTGVTSIKEFLTAIPSLDMAGIKEFLVAVPDEITKTVGTFSLTPYIIVTGILLLVYLCVAYGLYNALKEV